MLKKLKHLNHRFFSGYYNYLLVFLVLLFVIRPYNRSDVYLGIWKLVLVAVFVTAIFNSNHHKITKIIAVCFAVPAIVLSWLNLAHHMEIVFVLNAMMTLLFMVICVSSIIYDVVIKARVTMETLRGVVCAYFMVGFAFAYAFYLIEYLVPGSFHLIHREASIFNYSHYLSEMLYFSFVTLLTIGFGDISPVKDVGQTAVIIEGVIGQFYIAILVSRLVSIYSFYSDKSIIKTLQKDILEIKR